MKVKLKTLEKAMVNIFSRLKEMEYDEIDLDKDFYWNIDREEKYNPYQKPTSFSLGQLQDDWEKIQDIASNQGEVVPYSLVWVAHILNCMGEKKS